MIDEKGKPVLMLDDPDGTPWMMQAWGKLVDPNLTYDGLKDIGSRLKLPTGWEPTLSWNQYQNWPGVARQLVRTPCLQQLFAHPRERCVFQFRSPPPCVFWHTLQYVGGSALST